MPAALSQGSYVSDESFRLGVWNAALGATPSKAVSAFLARAVKIGLGSHRVRAAWRLPFAFLALLASISNRWHVKQHSGRKIRQFNVEPQCDEPSVKRFFGQGQNMAVGSRHVPRR